LTDRAGFAVKIDVFGNQNIFKDRKNSSQGVSPALRIAPLCNLLCGLLRSTISCSQSNHISLHMDVKERTLRVVLWFFAHGQLPLFAGGGKWWA
jgi:hypothetical protein